MHYHLSYVNLELGHQYDMFHVQQRLYSMKLVWRSKGKVDRYGENLEPRTQQKSQIHFNFSLCDMNCHINIHHVLLCHILSHPLGPGLESDIYALMENTLTHIPLHKMADFSQTIFADAFSWMKKDWFKFLRSLFLGVQLTIIQHWFR